MSAALVDRILPEAERRYARDLGRAFAGALIFGFPLLMTMEMWAFGFTMDRGRLFLFVLLSLPLLHGLSYFAGFRASRGFRDDVQDVLAALAVGFLNAAVLLSLFGLIRAAATPGEVAGMLALQAVPGAFGALLARRQLASGGEAGEVDERPSSYGGELFLMTAGALFIAFNVAPTEEMMLIAFKMTAWHSLLLAVASIALLHVMVYRVGFAGQEAHESPLGAFFHFTLPGYALGLAVSLYVLWTFGRTDGQALGEIAATVIVMGFPAAIGAAAARLLV